MSPEEAESPLMIQVKYSLTIYDETEKKDFGTLHNLESLPRFEVGDHFAYDFFKPAGDNLWRAIVTDVLQCFSGGPERPEFRVRLRIRKMTASEQGQIRDKHAT
jgi:hypothetical protein